MKTMTILLTILALSSCRTAEKPEHDLQGLGKNKRLNFAKHPADPVIKGGRYDGQVVDRDRWRPSFWIHKRNEVEKVSQYLDSSDYHLVRNIFVDNKFFAAAIPRHPEKIEFIIEFFDAVVPAAHSMLWYKFSPQKPVILFDNETLNPTGKTTPSLFLSSEAARPKNVPYDLFRGTQGDYVLVHTWFDDLYMARERASVRDDIQAVNLKLTGSQKRDLLQNSIVMSNRDGYRVLYNTVSQNNCHGALLRVIDLTLKNQYSTVTRILKNGSFASNVYPALAKQSLKRRGLYQGHYLVSEDPRMKKLLKGFKSSKLKN